MQFTTTDKESVNHGVKMLAYGGAGAGKTMLCSTAPKPLIISAEKGLLTLRRVSVPVIVVENIQDVREAYKWCAANARTQGIQTICLDSISEITEKCLHAAKMATKDPRQAYGAMADETIDLVKNFRDLAGFHVVVTAKQTLSTDPLTGAPRATPAAPGQQVGPALPYLFDEVFHVFTGKDGEGKTFHALRTHAAPNADAKDRSGVLDEIEYPDVSNIINKIMQPAT